MKQKKAKSNSGNTRGGGGGELCWRNIEIKTTKNNPHSITSAAMMEKTGKTSIFIEKLSRKSIFLRNTVRPFYRIDMKPTSRESAGGGVQVSKTAAMEHGLDSGRRSC